LIWFLDQIDPESYIASARVIMHAEVSKIDDFGLESKKIAEKVARRTYQKSLIISFENLVKKFYHTIVDKM
jgi:hypothetical protein